MQFSILTKQFSDQSLEAELMELRRQQDMELMEIERARQDMENEVEKTLNPPPLTTLI
jgi:hypothetical protein